MIDVGMICAKIMVNQRKGRTRYVIFGFKSGAETFYQGGFSGAHFSVEQKYSL